MLIVFKKYLEKRKQDTALRMAMVVIFAYPTKASLYSVESSQESAGMLPACDVGSRRPPTVFPWIPSLHG